jgi:hypothetical protein
MGAGKPPMRQRHFVIGMPTRHAGSRSVACRKNHRAEVNDNLETADVTAGLAHAAEHQLSLQWTWNAICLCKLVCRGNVE